MQSRREFLRRSLAVAAACPSVVLPAAAAPQWGRSPLEPLIGIHVAMADFDHFYRKWLAGFALSEEYVRFRTYGDLLTAWSCS